LAALTVISLKSQFLYKLIFFATQKRNKSGLNVSLRFFFSSSCKTTTFLELMAEFAYGGLEKTAIGHKKEKKRNLLRKLFRGGKKKPSASQAPVVLTEEQQHKINRLSAYVQGNIGVEPDPVMCKHLLDQHKWDLRQALVELHDFQDADDGILVAPNPLTTDMLGSENDQLTSCYIDALLFSMYATTTAFDPLLTNDTDDDDFDKRRLQTALRLFINRLRDGHLVRTDQVRRLREALTATGWEGNTAFGAWAQEDTSEFFLHLTNIFGLPFLPVSFTLSFSSLNIYVSQPYLMNMGHTIF
jgi:hypothetical protein